MPVVAAVDRSDRAESVISRAADLADGLGLDLHVVHVGSVGAPSTAGGFDPDRDRQYAGQKARSIARDLAETVDDALTVEAVGLEGNPAEAILEYSRERDAEYIVVSGRKRSPLGQAVFGSVTQSLLLNAERPVVAVP